jgi:subtilisin family serine protease
MDGGLKNLKRAVLRGTGLRTSLQLDTDGTRSMGPYRFPDHYEVTPEGRGDTTNPTAQHGTHMAQLIAGRGLTAELTPPDGGFGEMGMVGAGVAPQAKILPVSLAPKDGVPVAGDFTYGIPAGIRWAVDHGAKVISLSLGDAFLHDGACPISGEGDRVCGAARRGGRGRRRQ